MSLVTDLGRAWGSARTIAGAASVAGWSRRPTLQWPDRSAQELARLDAVFQTSLRLQLESARRYDGRFTLTSTQLGGGEPILGPMKVATACERHIRVLDAVTLMDDALLVLWGSTDQAEAATALLRLIEAGVLPPSSLERTGAATFPVDGLTAISLTEAAVEQVGTFLSTSRSERPTHLRAVATARPPGPVEDSATNGSGLTAVGG